MTVFVDDPMKNISCRSIENCSVKELLDSIIFNRHQSVKYLEIRISIGNLENVQIWVDTI